MLEFIKQYVHLQFFYYLVIGMLFKKELVKVVDK